MPYDVRALRAHFPALADGAAHFDGPGGSQVPDVVGAAVAATLTSAIANRGQVTPAERRADGVVVAARAAMADLLGAEPSGIVFGRSMTQLTYDFARMFARQWGPGDEVAVTRLDHDANIRPWVQAAGAAGASVRWIDFDPSSGMLTPDHVAAALSPRTRLVAVTGASNLIGTRPPVGDITRLAHDVGAVTYVDGVHLTPHAPVDVGALGADLYACSPYKFLGPHCGVVAGRPEVLEGLRPDKLLPASDEVPERFELGTLPYELLAGTTAAVDFLAGLGPPVASGAGRAPAGPRRERLSAAMTAVEQHEDGLRRHLERRLAALDGVTLHGCGGLRTPTLLFSVEGMASTEVQAHLAGVGVNAPAGSFYAIEASRWLGLGDRGAVRVGLAPYTDADDVDRLIHGVEGVLRER
jgi:cysteine desulfurase family protein (TIGR01976 family)